VAKITGFAVPGGRGHTGFARQVTSSLSSGADTEWFPCGGAQGLAVCARARALAWALQQRAFACSGAVRWRCPVSFPADVLFSTVAGFCPALKASVFCGGSADAPCDDQLLSWWAGFAGGPICSTWRPGGRDTGK